MSKATNERYGSSAWRPTETARKVRTTNSSMKPREAS
jgi:hypothetical protein